VPDAMATLVAVVSAGEPPGVGWTVTVPERAGTIAVSADTGEASADAAGVASAGTTGMVLASATGVVLAGTRAVAVSAGPGDAVSARAAVASPEAAVGLSEA